MIKEYWNRICWNQFKKKMNEFQIQSDLGRIPRKIAYSWATNHHQSGMIDWWLTWKWTILNFWFLSDWNSLSIYDWFNKSCMNQAQIGHQSGIWMIDIWLTPILSTGQLSEINQLTIVHMTDWWPIGIAWPICNLFVSDWLTSHWWVTNHPSIHYHSPISHMTD